MATPGLYPVQVEVDYPAHQSRWQALFRLPLSIPVLLFSWLLLGGAVLASWAAILVSAAIPAWLFEFRVASNRWQLRAVAYLLMLTDDYPPFEGDHALRYEVQHPGRLSRWRLAVWKFVSAIPHLIVLFFLGLSLIVVLPVSWAAIIFTQRTPEALHAYVLGIVRWAARVQAYLLSLTDEFPPFSFSAAAGSGRPRSYALASGAGVLIAGGAVAGLITFFATVGERVSTEVSYAALLAGDVTPEETHSAVTSAAVELTGATDPADGLYPFLAPGQGHRLVQFQLEIENVRPTSGPDLRATCFSLTDTAGGRRDATLLVVGGRVADIHLDKHETAEALVLFEVPVEQQPARLRYSALDCTVPILPEAEVIMFELR